MVVDKVKHLVEYDIQVLDQVKTYKLKLNIDIVHHKNNLDKYKRNFLDIIDDLENMNHYFDKDYYLHIVHQLYQD